VCERVANGLLTPEEAAVDILLVQAVYVAAAGGV
jgi:hypothetical protein